jgi:hypothetical protein
MTKWLTLPLALLCALAGAQTVTPTMRPHQNFVDNSGNPCALCSLYSYAAGTTTPQATFTDSTGTSQNTNPIVLDVAGGANIWLTTTQSYKFILKDALGNTIWTVDNVQSNGGLVPCSTPYAVQFPNSTTASLSCDPDITINPASHALEIGGAISGPYFTLRNLGTITSSWTLDITSPTTALNSLGAIPLGNLSTQGGDTLVMNAGGSSATPSAVALPTGCTNGVNYSTATHTWSCASVVVPLTSVASQAADTVVMNATGGAASPTAVALPTGCANGVNYNTTTHGWSCYTPSASTCTDVTSSRAFGTVYTATNRLMLMVTGSVLGGSGDSRITASWGSGLSVSNTTTTTVAGGTDGITFMVPAGQSYNVLYTGISGSPSLALQKWIECTF